MPFSMENGWLQILRKKRLCQSKPTRKNWKNYCEEVYVKHGWEATKWPMRNLELVEMGDVLQRCKFFGAERKGINGYKLDSEKSRHKQVLTSTVTTLSITPELAAPIVVPFVFLVLPLNAPATATVVSAPIVSSRRVPLSFSIAVQLSIPVYLPVQLSLPIPVLSLPVPLSTVSASVAILTLPVTMSAVFMPAASFAVVAVSSF